MHFMWQPNSTCSGIGLKNIEIGSRGELNSILFFDTFCRYFSAAMFSTKVFPNLSVFYLRTSHVVSYCPLVGTRSTNAHPPVVQALYGYDEGQDVDGEFLELSESPPPPPARDTVWRTANRATPDALKATPVPVRSSARQREKRLRESEQQLGGRVLNFQDPSQPTLVTRELEKAFADRDIQRRKNLPPVDPRGHTGVAAGATRAGAARDRRR